MSLIAHTQNFSTLTKNQALTILSQNNGTSTVIPGVDARLLKFLLTAQINAIWNGQDRSAALGGQLGTGVYVGTNLTVNQILHQAFVNGVTNKKFTSADETYVLYLGASGEGQSASACKVQPPPPCVAPPQTASLGDFVWEDKNGNGIQDSGEPGIAGVTVKLLGSDGTTVLKTATTDANGKYLFSNLAAGTYYVQFTTPSGYTFTTANAGSDDGKDSDANATTGKTGAYTLTAGQTNLTVDAGMKKPASWVCANNLVLNPSFELNTGSPPTNWTNGTAGNIGVYVDGKNVGYISGSGVMYQNVNVTPGNGYTLTFYSGSHNPKSQTVKIQYYNASNVALGTASVHTITSDLEVTGFGGPYTLTLGAAPTDAKYLRISVSANGYDYAKVDAVCLQAQAAPQTASLGDFVWEDKNGNGIQDSGEPGIAGVTVKLLGSDGTTVLKTATTDANGKYLFSNLAAGTYYVQFTTPSGYTFTTANAGSDDGKDSDANATTGKTGAYTLTAGQTNLTVDAGLKATPPPSAPGTGTPGYWMNHPNAWPVAQITIGGKTYPRDQAISLMKAPTAGDVTYTMFQALVSAKLNGLVGNNTTCVDKTIADADAWMAKYPLASGVSGSSDAWKVGEPLYKTLDDYNNGRLCAPHRN